MESIIPQSYVGIDVAKAHLDICWPDGKRERLENGPKAIQSLIRRAKTKGAALVCEASGGYERTLIKVAREGGVPLCRANAATARYFARGKGILAKTDRIDAAVVQAFGQENRPRPIRDLRPSQELLQAWLIRRDQLVDQLARERKRLANSPEIIAESIKRMIEILEEEIAQVEKQLKDAQMADAVSTAEATVLKEVIGVGPVTIWTMQAFLPELGELSRRRVAALAGLAPWPRDSGKSSGPRAIYGGRIRVRNVLYMAAIAARIHNPHLRSYYQRLISAGKPPKVATVAVMRKLLIHLNSLMHAHKNSEENPHSVLA